MTAPLLHPSTPFGARADRRLREAPVAWLTTTAADGTPQPNPVWFLWDGDREVLVYSRADAARLANLRRSPRVALHLDSDGQGGDIVILAGTARVDPDYPTPDRHPAYLAKYQARIEQRLRSSVAAFAVRYGVPIRIRVDRLRGF